MADAARPTPQACLLPARSPWTPPRLAELPKLTSLTLASPIGGGGSTGGGSTVFGLLLAVGLLAGCSPDRAVMPSEGEMPRPIAAVTCSGKVSTKAIACGGGPSAVSGREFLGGQGGTVALRSSNVHYVGTAFTFDVTVQNLGAQAIGVGPSGIDVFFLSAPVATVGVGTITVDNAGLDFFTATGQAYYEYDQVLSPEEISATLGWQFTIPGGVDEFTFTVLVAADVGDQGGVLRWKDVPTLSANPFLAVGVYTSTEAMAVGRSGRTWHWNGTSWTALARQTDEDLVAVQPLGSGEYFAVGNGGGIYRSKGKVWTKIHTAGDAMRTLWVQDSTHFVAVGADRILTYDAGAFNETTVTGPGGYLAFVGGTSDGFIRNVLSTEGELYTSINGAAWTDDGSIFTVASDRRVTGLFFDANNDMIWSFRNNLESYGAVMRGVNDTLYGGALARIPTAIAPLADDSMIVAINDDADATALVKIRYGLSFNTTITGLDPLQCNCQVKALTRADGLGDKFFVVTDETVGRLLRWAGSWQDQTPATLGGVRKLWMHLDTLYMVDGSSTMQQIADGHVVPVPITGPSGLQGIWGSETGGTPEMYGINGTGVYRRTGYDTWSGAISDPEGDHLYAIWGDATADYWVAVGQYGTVLYKNGGGWNNYPGVPPSFDLTGVWGCGKNAWMTTTDGLVMTFNDGAINYDYAFPGAAGALNAISGTTCSDIWVGGDNGSVYHRDGGGWHQFTPWLGASIIALSARVDGTVYFADASGVVGLFDPANGTTILRTTPGSLVSSLASIGSGELFAATNVQLAHGTR